MTKGGPMKPESLSRLYLLTLIALTLVLFESPIACAVKRASARSGKHVEEGMASWYGKKFHGKKTASGERFNMYELTAAHRTLPFGTKVKVTNLENNKSVVVRINDRGPHVKGRIIDLSYAAAKKIDMIEISKSSSRTNIMVWNTSSRVSVGKPIIV